MRTHKTTISPVTIATFPASRPAFAIADILSSCRIAGHTPLRYCSGEDADTIITRNISICQDNICERNCILSWTANPASDHGLRGYVGSSLASTHAIANELLFNNNSIDNDPHSYETIGGLSLSNISFVSPSVKYLPQLFHIDHPAELLIQFNHRSQARRFLNWCLRAHTSTILFRISCLASSKLISTMATITENVHIESAQAFTFPVQTSALVVREPKADFTMTTITLDEVRADEILVEMKYSGICHTVRSHAPILGTVSLFQSRTSCCNKASCQR